MLSKAQPKCESNHMATFTLPALQTTVTKLQ